MGWHATVRHVSSEAGAAPPGPTATIVLASASASRAELLRRSGINPVVMPSDVDEDAVLASTRSSQPGATFEQLCVALAVAKGRSVVGELTGSGSGDPGAGQTLVVGCDSMLELAGELVGKPGTPEVAEDRWRQLRGNSGVLHTGHYVALIPGDGSAARETSFCASSGVDFADVTDAEIHWYVATGEPLNVAGAFTLEGLAGPFISSVRGCVSNVMGMSLPGLRDAAGELGIGWLDIVDLPEP